MNGQNASQYSAQDLLSPDPDEAARAAEALFQSRDAEQTFSEPAARDALKSAVESGLRTAAAVLLLGFCDAKDLLKTLIREHGDESVKLRSWTRTVPLRIAATTALSRLGDSPSRQQLLAGAPKFESSVRVFLLDILPYIDAPELLHALSDYLQDENEIPEGVPSGAARRRVCDHAVDAYLALAQLGFKVSFAPNPGGRYDKSQIDEVLKQLRSTVPR